jgi:hypothetical protein
MITKKKSALKQTEIYLKLEILLPILGSTGNSSFKFDIEKNWGKFSGIFLL